MVHEELALRRNRAESLGIDRDNFIDKVEINEVEFAKKVCSCLHFIPLFLNLHYA